MGFILNRLSGFIERRPWLIVMVILLITIGFSLAIPSLEFKTNFKDFAPDNELVRANNRISEYFGTEMKPLFLLVKTKDNEGVLSVKSVRELYSLEKNLRDLPGVNSTVSLITFIDNICLIEYGKSIDNCTDEELSYAINDLLKERRGGSLKIFDSDDYEDFVYLKQGLTRLKGKKDYDTRSLDVKQCYVQVSNDTVTFSIEVYDLSGLSTNPLKTPLPLVNNLEWYISFRNLLSFSEAFNVEYQIAARIEPKHPVWRIGEGVVSNVKQMINHIQGHELYDSYKTTVYLYIKPSEQGFMIPYPLDRASLMFDTVNNRLNITIPRSDLGKYGIAPSFNSYQLPGRLSDFTVGVRYSKPSFTSRVSSRIVISSDYLQEQLGKLSKKPVQSLILGRVLGRYDITLEELAGSFTTMKQTGMMPGNISLLYMEDSWVTGDRLPDTGSSNRIVSLLPLFFNDLRVNALSFISKDYDYDKGYASQALILVMTDSSSDIQDVNEKLGRMTEDYNKERHILSLSLTGESVISSEINTVSMQANQIIGPAIFILIILILLISFRRLSYVLLPVIVFICSTIWLFGTMALLGISFNIIAVALLPINIGLGVEYSVNLLHNYRVERANGKKPADAIKRSIREVGSAIFLAWVTTCVAFLSFVTASIPPVRNFGLFLALGITYTFILDMTLLPSIRYIIDRKNSKNNAYRPGVYSIKTLMSRLACLLLKHEKKIIIIVLIASIIMGFGVTQLKTGFSMNQFIPENTQSIQVFTDIRDAFPSASQDQEYILIEGDVASVKTLKGIKETHGNMLDDRFITRKPDGEPKTDSIYLIIKEAVSSNKTLYSAFNINPETLIPGSDNDVKRLYDYLYEDDNYQSRVKSVLYRDDDSYKATVIRVYIDVHQDDNDMSETYEQLKKELQNDLSSYGESEAIITGQLIITSTIISSMTESQIISTVVCFILAFIMLTMIYRNPILGLVAMIPVTISIIWVLGTMYMVGYTLNILTITVTSLTIGVGIDYACYITERFRLVADRTGDVTTAVTETISRTGNAILIAALSSICGFGILLLAPIPPQQQFGLITATTLTYALTTSIIVLPLVLAEWAKLRKKKRGYIISPGKPEDDYDVDDYAGDQCIKNQNNEEKNSKISIPNQDTSSL